MPRSAKPRKRYNPAKRATRPQFVSIDEAYRICEPVRNIMTLLRGEVEVDEGGYPVMTDWDGKKTRVDHNLIAWSECWDKLFGNLDNTPLVRLANKLALMSPIFEEDLLKVEAIIDTQQRTLHRMSVKEVEYKMRDKQIATMFETAGLANVAPLKEAA